MIPSRRAAAADRRRGLSVAGGRVVELDMLADPERPAKLCVSDFVA
jgi:hypothetical protein